MTADFSQPPSLKHYFWLFVAVAIFHFIGTWSLPLIDRDEPRFAEASREMLERQDFVVPYLNNEYRFDKPPLTYWLQSSAYRVFGENEAAARLPSVLAAAAIAVIVLAWGTRLKDAALGWRAAVIFTLSLQVALHAKAAVADMLMVLFVVLAAWAGWEMTRREKDHFHWWAVFVGALALGFLAKGPIAWLPIIPVAMRLRGGRTVLMFVCGILLMLLLVSFWGIPALERTNGEFFKVGIGKHVVGRSVSAMEGHGAKNLAGYVATMPFYFLTIFASFAPWSWFLPRLFRQRKPLWQDPDQRYLLLQALLFFVVFSLVKTKLPHYTLPAFPMLALLIAGVVTGEQVRKFGLRMGGFFLILSILVFPFAARLFPAPSLAEQSAAVLKPEMEFASTEFVEPSLIWSFRKTVRGFHFKVDPKKAAKWMNKRGPRFYILPTDKVSEAFPSVDPRWKVFRHRGLNFAKFDPVDLTMLVKTE
ncbi:MAG TPA: glycosyltransferase family 39 protein [Chthoniobacterales bacterium]|jgi:4-amino-4-deoxy-L-arabinose transferase-like glycosyltransferase